jgi:hypothetical protein
MAGKRRRIDPGQSMVTSCFGPFPPRRIFHDAGHCGRRSRREADTLIQIKLRPSIRLHHATLNTLIRRLLGTWPAYYIAAGREHYVIAMSETEKFTIEHVTEVRPWTAKLFSFKTTRSPGYRFVPGQFSRLGIRRDG